MSLPIYVHALTVTETEITPQGPLACGTEGDENAARLRLRLELEEPTAYTYRLEVVTGDGSYDLTDRLPISDGALTFDVPTAWTAAGLAAVRLVRATEADGTELARQYYPPVLLQFAYRDEGAAPLSAPLRWQELIARAEAVLEHASHLADSALSTGTEALLTLERVSEAGDAAASDARASADRATAAADDCRAVQESVESLSGIAASLLTLTGTESGIEYPCVTVDAALNADSDNPLANRAVTAALETKSDRTHSHSTDDVTCANGGYWWGSSETLENALLSVSNELASLHTSVVTAAQVPTNQPGDTVESSLAGLWATKADASSMIAECIPFTYSGGNIKTVADALTLLLQKLGV